MNTDTFQKYIQQPETLTASSIAEIQEVLADFPYFQAGHFLYLKALYNQNNFKFNTQLKQSAVCVSNRKKLYNFLKETARPQVHLQDEEKTTSEQKSVNDSPQIEKQSVESFPSEPLKEKAEELQPSPKKDVAKANDLSPEEILQKRLSELEMLKEQEAQDATTEKSAEDKQDLNTEEFSQNLVADDDFKDIDVLSEYIEVAAPAEYFLQEPELTPIQAPEEKTTKRTFEDWLSRFQEKRQLKKIPKEERSPKKNPTSDLIDRFLSDKGSKIIKPKPVSSENYTKKAENEQPELNFMTETLAKIYIQQKQFAKAIEAYEKLSLKYPKKNSYFASQIENIKKIQLNS